MTLRLLTLDDDEENLYDFSLIGISCHLKGYRLCWSLNQTLDFDFERINPLEVTGKTGQSSHAMFKHVDDETDSAFYLIKNRAEKYLSPELKHADYFIKIENIDGEFDLLSKIKNTKGVLTAFDIDVNELKSKENYIF